MEKQQRILVTGASGFIGKNLVRELRNRGYFNIETMTSHYSEEELMEKTKNIDFIYHLAGVNRPTNEDDFYHGNRDFTKALFHAIRKNHSHPDFLMSSSTQAVLNNDYGISKKKGEEIATYFADQLKLKVMIYRLPNVFGKWSKPNYNSVIATFCYNISRNQKIQIHDASKKLSLVYIDDVIKSFIDVLSEKEDSKDAFREVAPVYWRSVGEIAEIIRSFPSVRKALELPDFSDLFIKKLYSTYLSFLSTTEFSYPLTMHCDARGSFTEALHFPDSGQISVNVSKPGVIKGNHWHHTKVEKFLVVKGSAKIRLMDVCTKKECLYEVSEKRLEIVDIPPGYSHTIENIGTDELVTVIWSNEVYDDKNPDTYFMEIGDR